MTEYTLKVRKNGADFVLRVQAMNPMAAINRVRRDNPGISDVHVVKCKRIESYMPGRREQEMILINSLFL